MAITPQQHTKIIEPGYNTLELDPVDEEYCQGRLVLSDVIKEGVLKALRTI